MPARKPLAVIPINRTYNTKLSLYTRGQIIAQAKLGRPYAKIAKDLKTPIQTVATTIRRAPLRLDSISQPRPGAPSKTDARTRRRILYIVKKDPRASYAKIREETDVTLSNSTIYRILQSFHMEHWIAKKRPILSEDHTKERLIWCENRKSWTSEDWAKVIFTDECSFERGSGKRPTWIWCYKGHRLDRNKVDTYDKGKDLSIMIWGGIWLTDRSNI